MRKFLGSQFDFDVDVVPKEVNAMASQTGLSKDFNEAHGAVLRYLIFNAPHASVICLLSVPVT